MICIANMSSHIASASFRHLRNDIDIHIMRNQAPAILAFLRN